MVEEVLASPPRHFVVFLNARRTVEQVGERSHGCRVLGKVREWEILRGKQGQDVEHRERKKHAPKRPPHGSTS